MGAFLRKCLSKSYLLHVTPLGNLVGCQWELILLIDLWHCSPSFDYQKVWRIKLDNLEHSLGQAHYHHHLFPLF